MVIRYINNTNLQENNNNKKNWYETIWGLVILTVGLNVFSNFIYERGREAFRVRDKERERIRERDFLMKYEGRTREQADKESAQEEINLDKEQRALENSSKT